VHALAVQAESAAHSDPRAACVYARLALETMVNWLYRYDGTLKPPYERTLSARIHEPTFRTLAGERIVAKARLVKNLGNTAAHEPKAVPFASAATALRELFHVAYWLVRTYAKGAKPAASLAFSQDALPRTATIPAATLAELQAAAQRFVDAAKASEEAEGQRQASEAGRQVLEEELAALRAEVAAAKAANARVPDAHDYDEAATRDYFIDKLLAEAGWTFSKPGRDTEFPVAGMPNKGGTGYVDYVLWGDDGKSLGIVEAKRTTRDAHEGQQQARLYADCLERMTGQRPVIFYTNGYEHHIWDDQRYPPRPIQGFLTKDELELAIRRRSQGFLRPLAGADIDPGIVERYYQTRAIRRIAEAFEKDNLRKALLVMATGSGKTRTVVALSDVMMRTNWARRILFLADRVALVNQTVGVYKKFLPSASPVNLITDKTATGRIYVSTYPTMMRLIDEMTTDGRKRFGPGHFDLIVIDEAHRSVYAKYGAIFAYFDSLLIGLTATPKDEIDRDTYRLFDLERGVPTDAYGLDDAVKDGFLVPPRAVSVPLKFVREGITYDELSEEDKEAWDAIEWSDEGEAAPERVEPAALNKWLFNKDTVDKVLEHLMTHGLKVAGGDRLGKTIIFAKSHEHALFIIERFDANYPHLKGSFARVVDFKTEYAQSLIDDFAQAEKAPHIAVSVDMLDTGIDVPEVANLVFFKIVRSKTKFWQMLGRGTRLCPDLFGPGRHKEYFQVFDFCQNLEFFNQSLPETGGAVAESLAKRLFSSRVDLIAELDDAAARTVGAAEDGASYGPESATEHAAPDPARQLRTDTTARLVEELAAMSTDNFLVRPKRRYVEKFARPEAWTKLGLDDRHELTEHLAGLPSGLVDDDLAAKQFDLLILRTQLAALRHDPSLEGQRQKVVAIASALEQLANTIPMVANELQLLLELQTEEYWTDITAPMLETARRRLRDLVKLIEPRVRTIVYSDFEDEISAGTAVAVAGVGPGTDMDRFRLKARHFLREHENHISVLKLKRNEPLTPTDLAELERMFRDAGAQPNEIEQARGADGGLGLFVRSLVGLERDAAKGAFAQFIAGKTLTANQIEFVDLIIDHLTERGAMDPRLLYESPFTDLDPMGIGGLFSERDVEEVVSILDAVRKRAAA
jgi:type I restriction enzyme R subunit